MELQGLLCGSEGKASACNVGDSGSIPGLGRSSGEGSSTPLQHSRLENPRDGGAWWVTVHGVAKSRTRLSDFTFTYGVTRPQGCGQAWRSLVESLAPPKASPWEKVRGVARLPFWILRPRCGHGSLLETCGCCPAGLGSEDGKGLWARTLSPDHRWAVRLLTFLCPRKVQLWDCAPKMQRKIGVRWGQSPRQGGEHSDLIYRELMTSGKVRQGGGARTPCLPRSPPSTSGSATLSLPRPQE